MARRLIAQADKPLIAVIVAIASLGLYNLASAGRTLESNVHISQAIFLALGIVVAVVVVSIDYRNFEGLAVPIFLLVVGLLVATLVAGKTVNGSKRWLPLGLFNLQASDLAKLAVTLIVAKMLHLHKRRQSGGLTLDELFRPLNISRPLLVVVGVLALTLGGDRVKPGELKQLVNNHSRGLATLSAARPEAVVGRGQDARVRLAHGGVEARHAVIERIEDSEYIVRDLGAASGVYVNNERVVGQRALFDGDVIRFGLNPRAEVFLSARIQKIRPVLPWVAIFGAAWLFVALWHQFKRRTWDSKDLVAPIDVVALPCALVLVQPDLGTTLVILAVAFTVILYVGLRPLSLLLLGVFSMATGVFAWLYVLKAYQKQRVLTFLNPTRDLAGAGYHQNQSLIAIGSGQIYGKGYKQGTQTQFSFLPEQQTDFIFSVWAEEQGFVGCAIVVVLFALFILLSLRIARNAKDQFGALLVVGATSMIFWHALVNMLMVLRLAPVVGVPLPFWSYGGSIMVSTMIAVGIILNVGMRRYVF